MLYIDENVYGVELCDVYVICLEGFNTFFQVTKTKNDVVFLTELQKFPYDNNGEECDVLRQKKCGAFEYAKKPLFVKKNNTYTKTDFFVEPVEKDGEVVLPFTFDTKSDFYKELCKYTDEPLCGTVYATRVDDPRHHFFPIIYNKKNILN